MEKKENVAGDILKELQEIEGMNEVFEEDIVSITYGCGGLLSIVCCTP